MRPTRIPLICLFFVFSTITAVPAQAMGLLRDPDIEYALKQLASPILKAAGLSPSRIDVLVINDRSLNAFVVDSNHIFIHSGLLLKMKSSAMLQSVLSHEAAHIANGHLLRRPLNARAAGRAAAIATAVGVAAGAAAGSAQAAAGAALGAQGSASRLFFVNTRAEENAADQSGLRFMAEAGIDTKGATDVLDIFRGQEALSTGRQDPYARTHPLSADRYRVVKRLSDSYAGSVKPNPNADYWFARAKSKLAAFTLSPKWTKTRAGEYGFADVKHMRLSVAYHRQSKTKKALSEINKAIAIRPSDPYYLELKGQILMETRQFQAAASAYGKAASFAPNNALILGSYGRAVLARGETKKAMRLLEKSRARDNSDSRVLRDLAVAHAKVGNNGMASLITAERYAVLGRIRDAGIHAKRASDLLPTGSVGWRRAQDVLSAYEATVKKKKKKK